MKTKQRHPIFFYVKTAGEIVLIFLFCVGLVVLVTHGKKETGSLTFCDAFQSSGTPSRQTKTRLKTRAGEDLPRSVEPKKKKKEILRTFGWTDPARKNRETILNFPEAALKREVKKFGKPHSMTNPLLLARRGFKIIGRRDYLLNRQVHEKVYTMVDYVTIFKRNLKYFPSLTHALVESAEMPAETDPMHTLLCFVQHIRYKKPPKIYKGKYIGEFFVPLVCLNEQYGDCDSKSLLLAEFLAGVPRSKEKVGMVLVRGNGLSHALLGVRAGLRRKLLPGMTAIFLKDKGYYLVLETTRPRWAPGFIGRRVTDALKAGLFQFVELN